MKVEYQPQYREGVHSSAQWYNAGHRVDKKTALSMVQEKLSEYTGKYPTKRMLKIGTEVLEIAFEVKFKETE